jgi:hypothetical protein
MNVNNYPPPTFSLSSLPNGTIGQSYNQTVSIVGGNGPFTIVTESVPGGVATTANGNSSNVTGTPVQATAINLVGAPTQLRSNEQRRLRPVVNKYRFHVNARLARHG